MKVEARDGSRWTMHQVDVIGKDELERQERHRKWRARSIERLAYIDAAVSLDERRWRWMRSSAGQIDYEPYSPEEFDAMADAGIAELRLIAQ